MTTIFRDAQGDYHDIDNVDDFLAMFDDPATDIWEGQTGSCGLWRSSAEKAEQLMVISHVPATGFAIDSEDFDGRAFAAFQHGLDPETGNQRIEFYVGGEPEYRERRFFLPAELAKAVAAQFIRTGIRLVADQIGWEPSTVL